MGLRSQAEGQPHLNMIPPKPEHEWQAPVSLQDKPVRAAGKKASLVILGASVQDVVAPQLAPGMILNMLP